MEFTLIQYVVFFGAVCAALTLTTLFVMRYRFYRIGFFGLCCGVLFMAGVTGSLMMHYNETVRYYRDGCVAELTKHLKEAEKELQETKTTLQSTEVCRDAALEACKDVGAELTELKEAHQKLLSGISQLTTDTTAEDTETEPTNQELTNEIYRAGWKLMR